MKNREAYNKLESMYGDKYFSMNYEIIHYASGRNGTICSLYVEKPTG